MSVAAGLLGASPVSAPPVRDASHAGAAAAEPGTRFDQALDRAATQSERAAPDDRAATAASPRSANEKPIKPARASDDKADEASAPIDEARGLLGWLQLQLAAPGTAGTASGSAAATATGGSTPASLTLIPSGTLAAPSTAAAPTATEPTARAPLPSLDGLPTTLPSAGEPSAAGVLAAFTLGSPAPDKPLSSALAEALAAALPERPAAANPAPTLLAPPPLPPSLAAAHPSIEPAPVSSTLAGASALAAPLTLDGADLSSRLGERLQWLAGNGVQEARLQLHPRDLGSIDVQIRIEPRGASVWFAAEHPAARSALEATLPQLRERFAADGLALGQAQVSAQTSAWTQGESSRQAWRNPFAPADGRAATGFDDEAESAPARLPVLHVGLVDRYA